MIFRPAFIRLFTLLLFAVSMSATASSAPSLMTDRQRAEILETIQPTLISVEKFIKTNAPAKSVEDLQTQIATLLHGKEVEEQYKSANLKLDQLAAPGKLTGAFATPNFDEVVPGIFRSANPSMSQVEQLLQSKTVDHVISLNPELIMLAKMDPGQALPLTLERKKVILEKIMARGKTKKRADSLLKFYENNLAYSQAIYRKTIKNHDAFPLDDLDETLPAYFNALNRITELRQQKKSVLFHCSVGKHRTGLIAMLVEILDRNLALTGSEQKDLYLEFVERNWNEEAQTRIHFMVVLPLITRSKPFQDLAAKWKRATI